MRVHSDVIVDYGCNKVTAVMYVILWPVLIAGQMAVIILWVFMLFSKANSGYNYNRCPVSKESIAS